MARLYSSSATSSGIALRERRDWRYTRCKFVGRMVVMLGWVIGAVKPRREWMDRMDRMDRMERSNEWDVQSSVYESLDVLRVLLRTNGQKEDGR
jgi:hypothetical protein